MQERFGNPTLLKHKLERGVHHSGAAMSFSALQSTELILDPDLAQLYRGSDAKEVRERAIAFAKAREKSHAQLRKEAEEEAAAMEGDSDDEVSHSVSYRTILSMPLTGIAHTSRFPRWEKALTATLNGNRILT